MMKAVICYFLASNITNDNCGARKIFLDNMYACPDLFVILFKDMNPIGSGTCRKNIIVFPGNDERLTLPKFWERGDCRQIYNRCLHLLSTMWKDSNILRLISSLRKTRILEVSRRKVQDIHQVVCPDYLTKYNHNMDGVDWGDQLREHSDGLSSKSHFKSGTHMVTYVCVIFSIKLTHCLEYELWDNGCVWCTNMGSSE